MSEIIIPEFPREWTYDDLTRTPDGAYWYQIVDGALHISPHPDLPHQYAVGQLANALHLAAPPDVVALSRIGIDCGRSVFIADLVVVARDVVLSDAPLVRPFDLRLVVEIVSVSSASMDRLVKPARYAEAGIPSYWRVEGVTSGEPSIVVYNLDGCRYQETVTVSAGEQVEVDRPFPVTLAPAQLVP